MRDVKERRRGECGFAARRFPQSPTLLGPGRLYSGLRSNTSQRPQRQDLSSLSAGIQADAPARHGRPLASGLGSVAARARESDLTASEGLARYARTRGGAQKGQGLAARPMGPRATANPASVARPTLGPATEGGPEQVRGRGAVLGDPAHCARPSHDPAPAGGGAAAFTGTPAGRRRQVNPPAARAAGPRAPEAPAALGPWSLVVTRRALAWGRQPGRCHLSCCCCRCCRRCWVGGCVLRPRPPPPLGRRLRTAAPWRSSPLRRRRRRAIGKTA